LAQREQNYSQIEKEGLALTEMMTMMEMIYGRKCIFQTMTTCRCYPFSAAKNKSSGKYDFSMEYVRTTSLQTANMTQRKTSSSMH